MSDSTPVVNDPINKTVEANLAEAKQAIESIEAQLLEVKSCIRSVEAVQDPSIPKDVLRALCRKFFVMGAEAQADNISYSDCEFGGVEVEGSGDGLSWTYRGDVYVDAYDIERQDPITFGDCVISDNEIDEVISKHTGKTQAE
jgi:hypothetical protein